MHPYVQYVTSHMYSVRPEASRSSPGRLMEPSASRVGRDWRSNRKLMRSCGAERTRYRTSERRVKEERKRKARRTQKRPWRARVR